MKFDITKEKCKHCEKNITKEKFIKVHIHLEDNSAKDMFGYFCSFTCLLDNMHESLRRCEMDETSKDEI